MTPFRSKPVRVTTKEELDAALASSSARSIVVEGDEELLTYAAQQASAEPDLSIGSVAFGTGAAPAEREPSGPTPPRDTGGGGALERDDPFAWPDASAGLRGHGLDRGRQFGQSGPPRLEELSPAPPSASPAPPLDAARPPPAPASPASGGPVAAARPGTARGAQAAPAGHPAPARSGKRWIWLLTGAVAATLGAGLFWLAADLPDVQLLDRAASPPAPSPPAATAPAPSPPAPSAPAPGAPPATTHAGSDLPSLIWPVVAIVAIVALYLVARQAISSGSNVEIHWRVTEKVTGRLVITKQTRPAKKIAA